MKKVSFQKEQYRGSIKQMMKARRLRSLSISNFNIWKGEEPGEIHSLKLDLMNGYIDVYRYNGTKFGTKIDDVSEKEYSKIYNIVNEMFQKEFEIPYKQRKNIFVSIGR